MPQSLQPAKKRFTMSYWRVGFVMLLYANFYMGVRNIMPWWMLTFSIPFYILLRPGEEIGESYEKVIQDGVIFYLFKWILIWVAVILTLIFFAGISFSFSWMDVLRASSQNISIVSTVFVSVLMSWIVNKRHYQAYLVEQANLADKARRKKKKKHNR